MPVIPRLFSLWRNLTHKARVENDLDQEVRSYLDLLTDENIKSGMGAEEARRAAMIEVGGVEQVKEQVRDTRIGAWLETLLQDLRFGLRQLRRNPGFTVVAIITLALGIGANTAIFSAVDTVLLRPLPYKNPSRLVWATERFPFSHGAAGVISPDFVAWKDHNEVFQQIGASGGAGDATLTGAGWAARVSITNVTTSFFPMLGVRPILGRIFLASEGMQGHNHVALLSESLWRNRFDADSHIVGKTIPLNGAAYTVVGVMPAMLHPGTDIWTPFALDEARFSPHSPRWAILTVVARLKPGVRLAQAQSDLQIITQRMDKEYPPQAARFRAHERVQVILLHALLVQNVRSLLLILLGAAGFVLLIASANVANLQLSRGVVRGKEMAVRAALGARRGRLIRQLLTEGLLLAVAGGVLGVLAGLWGTNILKQLIPPNLPSDIHLDLRILGFSVALAVISVLVFGFVPALIASRADFSETLKEGGMHAGKSFAAHRLRGLMLAGEIALSLILLIGTGLLARSFMRLTEVQLGFDPHGLLIATAQRSLVAGSRPSEYAAFFQNALERVRHLPGVKGAAVTSQYPLGPPHNGTLILDVQGTGRVHPSQGIRVTDISPEYFHVMGTALLRGRIFGEGDTGAQPVVIVNDSLARMLFGDRDPLEQRIRLTGSGANWMRVVGVVSSMRSGALQQEPGPEMFIPYLQQPSFRMTFVLRTDRDPSGLATPLRNAVQQIDKDQPLFDVTTMEKVIANATAPRRFKMLLLGVFALLALGLAAVGIYGVVSYAVARRTHEIGIRMALGAQKSDVLRLVVGQGMILALIGVGIGIAGALGLTRFLSSLLYGIKPTDPLTFAAVSFVLIGVALLACYIPARRAAQIDPIAALRHE
ncbi:MAG TPA: ABC transporter permease [Terriglobia bacterium]|nr:ABC transporter permease [Terriglobia bacterium]